MRWVRKSELDEHYCAIHNVDCPLQDHQGDPMVLHVNPHSIPSAWICPQAVKELEQFGVDAEDYIEQNNTEPAGFELPDEDEEFIVDSIEKYAVYETGIDDLRSKIDEEGVESLTLEELDGLTYVLDEIMHEFDAPDEVRDRANTLYVKTADHWEANA